MQRMQWNFSVPEIVLRLGSARTCYSAPPYPYLYYRGGRGEDGFRERDGEKIGPKD